MRRSLGLMTVVAAGLATVLAAGACASGGPAGAATGSAGSGARGAAMAAPQRDSAAALGTVSAYPGAGERVTTTVIIVRHAEKAVGAGDDPRLSDAGEARARALAHALADAGVSAVITTQFVRTGETAAPTARAAGVAPEVVPVKWDSVPQNASAIAATIRRHAGGVVLVVGHSNTVPEIVAALGAEKPEEICDSEYDRMEIVTMEASGRARVIESRYGVPTPVEAGCASMR